MSEPKTPEEWLEAGAAYVLGALPPLEEQAFRRQMMRDEELAEYVERLAATGDDLLSGVAQVDAPPQLQRTVMQAAAADLVADRVVHRAPAQRRSGFAAWLDRVAAAGLRPAAGVAAALLIAVGAFALGQELGQDSVQPRADRVVAIAPAAGNPVAGDVTLIDGGKLGAMVSLKGLDADHAGHIYQLWVAHDDQVTPSSLFDARADGTANSVVTEDVSRADAVMVTLEPAGGSLRPTGEVVGKASLQ